VGLIPEGQAGSNPLRTATQNPEDFDDGRSEGGFASVWRSIKKEGVLDRVFTICESVSPPQKKNPIRS